MPDIGVYRSQQHTKHLSIVSVYNVCNSHGSNQHISVP